MICPGCCEHCVREAVDIGVGTQFGPWHCVMCGWEEGDPSEMTSADWEAFLAQPGPEMLL